jgi:serine protease Do
MSLAAVAVNADALPDFRELVRNNQASVVNISTTQTIHAGGRNAPGIPFDELPEDSPFREFFKHFGQPAPQDQQARSLGSGFIISADGKVLTNAHVVDGADSIVVKLSDRTEKTAKVIGIDKATDVALLKVDAKNLVPVKLGDSDKLAVGEWVLAIGSPFGLESTATQGIVSALGRSLPDDTYVPFIQTDVPVNPGNSGGPLFNLRGEVVGINSQIYSRTGGYMGLSFAIPINVAHSVALQLEQYGHVQRGWLGVQIQSVTGDLAKSFGLDRPQGALVGSVDPKGPAARAGLKSGDIIIEYDGHKLNDSADLPPLVGATAPGKAVKLEVLRAGKTVTLTPTITALKDGTPKSSSEEGSATGRASLNITVAAVPAGMREALELNSGGVVVAQIGPGPAQRAGIQEGDVILQLDGKDVTGPSQFVKLAEGLPRGKPVAVLIQREQGRVYLAITLPTER